MTTSDPTGGGSRDPFELLLDLALYAPVGAAITLRSELPKHVRQGRQALENRVQLARFIGQLAVQTGQRELAKRLREQREQREAADTGSAGGGDPLVQIEQVEQDVSHDGETADHTAGTTEAPLGTTVDTAVDTAVDTHAAVVDDVPSAADLPIRDYESVPAINVVERLRSMSPDEIELVRRFEVAHRGRRTILAKIDQLQQGG
ncbi:MAG: hypothetical protein U0Q03_13380 [Acidimicrobiales bacterium]